MAKFTVGKGLDEYISKLGNLEFDAPHAMGQAIYEGAKIVADAIRAEIDNLPVDDTPKRKNYGVRTVEIEGLREGLGIAAMKNDDGFMNVKIGMDGYNAHVTKKCPKGHANAMVARSINSGTSFMRRIPFIDNTTRRVKSQAEEAMKIKLDESIEAIMKE